MPNSLARSGTGGASPPFALLSLIKLTPRGGRGLDRSGPVTDGLLCLGGETFPLSIFDGLRKTVFGSDGRRGNPFGIRFSATTGNVCDLFSGWSGFRSSCAAGGLNPP